MIRRQGPTCKQAAGLRAPASQAELPPATRAPKPLDGHPLEILKWGGVLGKESRHEEGPQDFTTVVPNIDVVAE